MAYQEAYVSTYAQSDFDRLLKRIFDTGESYYKKFGCIPLELVTFQEDNDIFHKGDRAVYFAGESFILERDYSVIGYDRTIVSPNGKAEEEDANYRMLALRDGLLNQVIGVVFAVNLPGVLKTARREPFAFRSYGKEPDTAKELKKANTYLNKRCNECNEALAVYCEPLYTDVQEQYQAYFDANKEHLFKDEKLPEKNISQEDFLQCLKDEAFAQLLDYTYAAMLEKNPKWNAFLLTLQDKTTVEKKFFYEPFVNELKKHTAMFLQMLRVSNFTV